MDRGHKKEYFNVMYTSYKNRHANRDTLLYICLIVVSTEFVTNTHYPHFHIFWVKRVKYFNRRGVSFSRTYFISSRLKNIIGAPKIRFIFLFLSNWSLECLCLHAYFFMMCTLHWNIPFYVLYPFMSFKQCFMKVFIIFLHLKFDIFLPWIHENNKILILRVFKGGKLQSSNQEKIG